MTNKMISQVGEEKDNKGLLFLDKGKRPKGNFFNNFDNKFLIYLYFG